MELESIFKTKEINIAHIANALAQFQKINFQATNTPYDRYLRGDKSALSIEEKKGFLVFAEEGRCIRCHFGPLLSNQSLQNIVVAPIGPGTNGRGQDRGRFETDRRDHLKYRFVTSPLRNIIKTAPYFHNGSALDLKGVIEHYNRPFQAIDDYDGRVVNNKFSDNYEGPLLINRNPYQIYAIKETKSPIINTSLNLSVTNKEHLLLFMKKSLTQD